jgi:hypothetical protein
MSKFPTPAEFRRLPKAEQRRILAAMNAETAAAEQAVREREAVLRAAGANWNEICRDLRGDPSVARKYGLPA